MQNGAVQVLVGYRSFAVLLLQLNNLIDPKGFLSRTCYFGCPGKPLGSIL
jgi:hypothetical protein